MAQTELGTRPTVLGLKVGDLVEVRSADEILATLDERGELENLPFMPEMLAFCGQRLTVKKVAHKLCDTIGGSGMRRMTNAVHLTESRCDGSAHGGCQTACSLYWKEQWLRRVDPGSPPSTPSVSPEARYNLPILEINSRKEPGPDGRSAVFLPGHRVAARRSDVPTLPRPRPVRPGRQQWQCRRVSCSAGVRHWPVQPHAECGQEGATTAAVVP